MLTMTYVKEKPCGFGVELGGSMHERTDLQGQVL